MMADILGLALMFALRLGVPLVVIMGLSYAAYRWLGAEKSLEKQAERARPVFIPGPAPMASVLYNAAGQRCWEAHNCTPAMQAHCPAAARPELPCWLAIQMKTGHLKSSCPECEYYDRPALQA